jgi:hypothetical protein
MVGWPWPTTVAQQTQKLRQIMVNGKLDQLSGFAFG